MTDQRTDRASRDNRERVTGPFRRVCPATDPANERLWDASEIPGPRQNVPLYVPPERCGG